MQGTTDSMSVQNLQKHFFGPWEHLNTNFHNVTVWIIKNIPSNVFESKGNEDVEWNQNNFFFREKKNIKTSINMI